MNKIIPGLMSIVGEASYFDLEIDYTPGCHINVTYYDSKKEYEFCWV